MRGPFPRGPFLRGQCLAGCLGLALAAAPLNSPLAAEEWTNLAGTATIEADFVGLWDGKVILQKPDGSRVSVAKENLQALSRLRVDELVAERAAQLEKRMAELRDQPQEVTPIPPAEASAPYQEWPASAKPEELLQHVAAQLQAGHPRVLWDALPATYQKDVQALVRLFAEEMNAEQYTTAMQLTSRLAHALYAKREFVLGYPKLAMLPPEARDAFAAAFTPAVALMAELSDLETLSLENLKNTDLAAIIAQKDESMGPYLAQLLALGTEPGSAEGGLLQALAAGQGTIVMEGEDRLKLTLPVPAPAPAEQATQPGGPVPPSVAAAAQPTAPGARNLPAPTLTLVRVEERWVPEGMAKNWAQGVARLHEQLSGLSEKTAADGGQNAAMAMTIEPLVTRLEEASTQEEFNAVIDPYVNLLMLMMPQSNRTNAGQYPGMGMAP